MSINTSCYSSSLRHSTKGSTNPDVLWLLLAPRIRAYEEAGVVKLEMFPKYTFSIAGSALSFSQSWMGINQSGNLRKYWGAVAAGSRLVCMPMCKWSLGFRRLCGWRSWTSLSIPWSKLEHTNSPKGLIRELYKVIFTQRVDRTTIWRTNLCQTVSKTWPER